MWKKPKELAPNRSKKSVEVKRVLTNEKEETDTKKIVNVFNDFYGGIAAKLAEKFKKNEKLKHLEKRLMNLSNLKQQQQIGQRYNN